MPEGDTIFRTARALGRALGGKAVVGFRSTYPLLARWNDEAPLCGQTVECVEPRGKWLLIHFSGGATLATHMLMNGSWHIYRHGQRWQQPRVNMRIVIENSDYIAVGFRVPVAEMHTAETLTRHRKIPAREADVLSANFDGEAAMERLLARGDDEVGEVLLDQRVLAGVGNVFKSEICHLTGAHPFAKVSALTRAQAEALVREARKLVAANVLEDSTDRIVTYRGRTRRTTHEDDPDESLWVYGRAGAPCRRCGDAIRRRLQGVDARVTFWCARCQPMPDGREVDG